MSLKQQFLSFLSQHPLYGITCQEYGASSHLDSALQLAKAGVPIIQYRAKNLPLKQQEQEIEKWKEEKDKWKKKPILIKNTP